MATIATGRAPRSEPFGYTCHRCGRCCHGMRIQLNPYEVARLARHRGTTTTVFRRDATVDGRGVELRRDDDGGCVLLGESGCTAHAARPLVCRLYPLGRSFGAADGEAFTHVVAQPGSAGEHHGRGTIGDFLESQDAEPFIAAADAYLAWLNAAMVQLRAGGAGDAAVAAAPLDDDSLLDMDAALAAHGGDTPSDIEARKDLHLAILHRHLVPA